jgi:hypothetical protein
MGRSISGSEGEKLMFKKTVFAVLLAGLTAFSATAQVKTTVSPTLARSTAQNAATGKRRRVPPPPNALKFGPPRSGQRIANPIAAQQTASLNSLLMSQRQAANTEAMKLRSANPAATRALNPQPVPPRNSPQVLMTKPGSLGPSHTMASSTMSSRIAQQPLMNTTALTCAHEPGMKILNVSGSSFPATFTPIQQYNFYTITGCSFGNIGPNAKVYIYKGSVFHEEFRVQEWHDNWINLNLDPNLTGLGDQDNLTLVVQRADGRQASKGGFKFHAARTELLLRDIPRRYFSLDKFNPVNMSSWKDTYNSPASGTDGYGFGRMSAEVQWFDPNMSFMKSNFDTANAPHAGTDIYDFSHLQPGFVPTGASLEWQDAECGYASGTLTTTGIFGARWQTGNQLWVNWRGQNCRDMKCGNAFEPDCFEQPLTNYGLDVWVEGPRGVDPWTGLPTKQ